MKDDLHTRDYFDRFTPHFNPSRFEFALELLKAQGDPSQKLIDIGCGDGATLAMIRDRTPLRELTGLDVSESYLSKARESLGCDTIRGSILDPALTARLEGSFDYAVMGAVLHHIIDRSRSSSRLSAETAIAHAFRVLKPGGHFILYEPTFRPRAAMFAVFWIKQMLSRITSERVHLGAQWANVGQPIVSYYTDTQVASWVRREQPDARFVSVARGKMLGIVDRHAIGLIAQKAA